MQCCKKKKKSFEQEVKLLYLGFSSPCPDGFKELGWYNKNIRIDFSSSRMRLTWSYSLLRPITSLRGFLVFFFPKRLTCMGTVWSGTLYVGNERWLLIK